MRVRNLLLALTALLLGAAVPAAGQSASDSAAVRSGETPARPAGQAAGGEGEIELVFEREIFSYPSTSRRDPFSPLQVSEGPRFEELTLRGIIHSAAQNQSVVLLADPGGKIYRVRRGETVGNARVLDVSTRRVLFAVNNFGVVRQEMLELKRKEPEGAKG